MVIRDLKQKMRLSLYVTRVNNLIIFTVKRSRLLKNNEGTVLQSSMPVSESAVLKNARGKTLRNPIGD